MVEVLVNKPLLLFLMVFISILTILVGKVLLRLKAILEYKLRKLFY